MPTIQLMKRLSEYNFNYTRTLQSNILNAIAKTRGVYLPLFSTKNRKRMHFGRSFIRQLSFGKATFRKRVSKCKFFENDIIVVSVWTTKTRICENGGILRIVRRHAELTEIVLRMSLSVAPCAKLSFFSTLLSCNCRLPKVYQSQPRFHLH